MPKLVSKELLKFLQKVDKNGSIHLIHGQCWEWTGSLVGGGYGQYVKLGECLSHRVSWRLYNGEIPNKLFVLHKCDNPKCVNPSHLFLGTYQDNANDMVAKGRQAKGERNGSRVHPERVAKGERHMSVTKPESVAKGEGHYASILTEEIVINCRKRYKRGKATYSALAVEFGVSLHTMWEAIKRITWKHVE